MRPNPFNPTLPARPEQFVGRGDELEQFSKNLSQTIYDTPMNLSVTGGRGMGKTSLLNKFEEIGKKQKSLVLRISNYEGNVKTIPELAEYLSTNIHREYLSKSSKPHIREQFGDWIKKLKPTLSYGDISLSVEYRYVMQDILSDRLRKLWNEIKDEFSCVVILIDEAEAIESIDGGLAFLREVFQKIAFECKYLLVLAGKLNFPERMSESFSPLNRFFPAERLENLTSEESEKFLETKLKTVEVSIDKKAIKTIIELSEGHPYVLVAIAHLVFDSLAEEENTIDSSIIQKALPKVTGRLENDFFRPMHHALSPQGKKILKLLANNSRTTDFSFKEAVEWSGIQKEKLAPYLNEFYRKGVINKPQRAKYAFFHSLFVKYVRELPV